MKININLIEKNTHHRNVLHAIFVAIFLVIAHIAMIFGMLAPSVLGYKNTEPMNMDHSNM